jgi:hypothetical protein
MQQHLLDLCILVNLHTQVSRELEYRTVVDLTVIAVMIYSTSSSIAVRECKAHLDVPGTWSALFQEPVTLCHVLEKYSLLY